MTRDDQSQEALDFADLMPPVAEFPGRTGTPDEDGAPTDVPQWTPGTPGPSGQTRRDGFWPCQCMTCSACTHPTILTAEAAATDPSADKMLCTDCTRRGHARRVWSDDATRPKWEPQQSYRVDEVGTPEDRAWEAERDRVAAEESARRKAEQDLEYWDSRSWARFAKSAIDAHSAEDALPDIAEFKTNVRTHRKRGINLVLMGTLGGGKTYLMNSIARALVKDGVIAPQLIRFGTEAELLYPLVVGYPSDQKAYRDDFTDPARTQMIMIDEVGRGNFTREDDRFAAWDIVTGFAYNHDIPLIVTTNLLPRLKGTASGDLGAPAVVDRAALARSTAPSIGREPVTQDVPEQSFDPAPAVPSVQKDEPPTRLEEYIGSAAYDRLINSTPREKATEVMAENRRGDVNRGTVARNHADEVDEGTRPW